MNRHLLVAIAVTSLALCLGSAAPAHACQSNVSANGTFTGSWSPSCASAHRSGRYAWYYTFTVSGTVSFQADLASSQDTYLYLLSGSGSGGSVITSDDDGGGGTNSRISRTLTAGTYTIEATTYYSGATGSYTLTLQSSGGGGGGGCQSSVSANSTTGGSWTSACTSSHRSGRYAKYYTFTVSDTVSFQADLTSSTDAYLYLLSGSGSGGSVIASDDDSGGSNNSRITRTLSPGTYTMEATTYNSGATGSFTLILQSSGGGGGGGCQFSVSSNSTTSGSWTSGCASAHRSGRYAKYYTFTVSDTVSFQADLTSATDAYLYLLVGSGSGGSVVASDDDSGGNNNSRITRTLSPGTYTMEATTYSSGATGSFMLILQSSGGGGGGGCQFSVSSNSTTSGSWTSGCASAHRSGRYAKYYTFTVSDTVSFQADLTSSTDAYLYLLAGSGSGGSVVASDDDSGGNNNSRITRTLSPGTYTMEATTYSSGAIGSFTLILQSSGGGGGGGCQFSVNATSTTGGSWTSGCTSVHRSGRYAKYYTFTVSDTVSFQADLTSSTDAYLFLLSGSGSGGSVVASDDDSGGNNNSRITRTLSPGTYTMEATTYGSGATGSFTLTLQSSGGGGGGGCQFSVSANSTTGGSWTSGCASAHRSGRYAKYYTFTVSNTVSFQADLTSSSDAYLFLLNGSGSGGSVIAEDDDGGGGSNSRITRSLSAGTYTIEATTYYSAATGSFTLTLQASGTSGELACLIFVHGSREADADSGYDWSTDWQAGRNYWKEKNYPYQLLGDSQDFIRSATNVFQRSFYVVRYNGAAPWWDDEASGQVASEIVRATNGLSDGGGNHCRTSASSGGVFWVVTHSGGANVMDYILGNSRTSDPNYNDNGPFDQAAGRISGVISVGGSHRGTPVADIICDPLNGNCPLVPRNCTQARVWLQTSDAYQVNQYSSSPSKIIWLTGGYKGDGVCEGFLPGEDDAVLPYSSQFACGGGALGSYSNSNVCGNNAKQESSNFRNLDAAYEDHDDEKNNYNTYFDRARRSIPDGIWVCNGHPCSADTRMLDDLSTAAFVDRLLRDSFGRSRTTEIDLPSLSRMAGEAYLAAARYPQSSAPLAEGNDPIVRDRIVTRATVRGPEGEEPTLTIYPAAVSFEAPEPVVLQAYLQERGSRLPASHLSGRVTDAQGRLVDTLDFRDDGEGGDAVAGDRLYSALFTPPAGQERAFAGIYSVSVQAAAAGGIERVGTSAFWYSAPDARLTGRFDDRAVDGSLQIRTQVEVTAPGRFHLEGTLYTADGRSLAWAQEARQLTPGLHWIPLTFYGLALREKGADGPYVLRHLALSTTTRVPGSPSRPVENAHVTSQYRAADFTARPFNDPELLQDAARLLRAPAN